MESSNYQYFRLELGYIVVITRRILNGPFSRCSSSRLDDRPGQGCARWGARTRTNQDVSRVAERRAREDLRHGEEYGDRGVRSLLPDQPGMGSRRLRKALGYDCTADC